MVGGLDTLSVAVLLVAPVPPLVEVTVEVVLTNTASAIAMMLPAAARLSFCASG